jgi:hypothetical protein
VVTSTERASSDRLSKFLVTGYRKEREGKRKFSKNFQKTLARLKKVVLPFEHAHVTC